MIFTIFILLTVLVSGCGSIRDSVQCTIPSFEISPPHSINEYWPEKSYFRSSCNTESAKSFIVSSKLEGVTVLIETNAVRPGVNMYPRSESGEKLIITGKNVFVTQPVESYALNIDTKSQNNIEFDLKSSEGVLIETFNLKFRPAQCDCVGYDVP